jgi:hypothetical protein
MARWLSNDLIGISGGLNQYVVFKNSPVNFADPEGTWNDLEHGPYYTEDHGWTAPYWPWSMWRHFRKRENVEKDLQNDIEKGDKEAFKNHHMHQGGDSFSHYDQGHRWYTIGHLFAWHRPDDPILHPKELKAMQAWTRKWEDKWRMRFCTPPSPQIPMGLDSYLPLY